MTFGRLFSSTTQWLSGSMLIFPGVSRLVRFPSLALTLVLSRFTFHLSTAVRYAVVAQELINIGHGCIFGCKTFQPVRIRLWHSDQPTWPFHGTSRAPDTNCISCFLMRLVPPTSSNTAGSLFSSLFPGHCSIKVANLFASGVRFE